MSYNDFSDMPVWKTAFYQLLDVYRITKKYPKDERYGLTSDMKRAANSITHNVAEGFGRFESKDKTRFYKISRGSAYELMSQTYVSMALEFINSDEQKMLIKSNKSIIKELNALIKTIES